MIDWNEKEIESDIVQFASEKTVSDATMSARLMAIKKFYRANRIKLDWEYILDLNKGEHIIHEDRPHTKEQIATILEHCDIRTRELLADGE